MNNRRTVNKPAPKPQQQTTGNLLGLGFDEPEPVQQPAANTNQGSGLDLLSDIFGPNTSTPVTNPAPQTQPQAASSQSNNILGDLMGFQMNQGSETQGGFPQMQTQNNPASEFSPYQINTDTFEEIWENSPDEDSYDMTANINSPQQFHQIITSKGNFAAVDIQNNEAISCAYYKGKVVLLHATIESGHVPLLVKCQNNQYNKEIADYVMSLFK